MTQKIIIFGAGYAGIETALTLQKKKKKDDIEISIIDKNSYHTLLTELHEVAGNRISEDGVIVPLHDIFKYTGVKVIKDDITKIDFENKKLISESNSYQYDYLVIAAGSEPNFYGIEGMKENSLTLWSFKDAVKIRERIKDTFAKASIENDLEKRKRLLTIVVGGGGFTGVELIGELANWMKSLCKEYSIRREEVKLILVEALSKILSNIDEKCIEKSMKYLTKKLKVDVKTDCAITKVTKNSVELKSGEKIESNTIIWTAGVRASCITDQVDVEKVKSCRIHVNEFTETKYKNVYAVGDISAFVENNNTIPALVEAALQTGHAAAKNILLDINGKEKEKLIPKLHGVMVSIGSFFAVSDIMGFRLPRFLSLFMKYLVNVHYLFGIGGIELIIKYFKHEVFDKKQKKFLIEQHYSINKRAFWLVPLRLFFGYTWFMEGLKKIFDGWLLSPVLVGLPTDATTSASVTEGGKKVFQIISENTPFWYAWFANSFVLPNAYIFQIIIVCTEIALGLAFFSGTLTFLAGAGSLALMVNFIFATGVSDTSWWYFPASIAMMCGAGNSFGFDYYIIPYLMRQWRYFVRNKKIKIILK